MNLKNIWITNEDTNEKYWLWYEELTDGGICLYRVYGQTQNIILPQKIEGKPLRIIGAYCFSENCRIGELETVTYQPSVRPLCGEYIRSISLPCSVKELDRCAFYNCRKMKKIEMGSELRKIDGEAFMNCMSLHHIVLHGNVTEPSGLRYLLSQLAQEVEVTFIENETKVARLLYPEYVESYEEIGPAHIFGLNVEGEGYRARQQFSDETVELSGYDAIFEKAVNEEGVTTLIQFTLNRLMYPVQLREEQREQYHTYLKNVESELVKYLVDQESLDELTFVIEKKLISDQAYGEAVRLSAQKQWARGSAALLRMKPKKPEKKDRYSFDW